MFEAELHLPEDAVRAERETDAVADERDVGNRGPSSPDLLREPAQHFACDAFSPTSGVPLELGPERSRSRDASAS